MAQIDEAADPELAIEQTHLAATLAAIERAIAVPLKEGTGAGDETAVVDRAMQRARRRAQLVDALDSPHFARIDFVPEVTASAGAAGGAAITGAGTTAPTPSAASSGSVAETYYIGKTYVEGEGVTVTSWQAPVAALVYRSTSAEVAYVAPEGEIRGALQLKRRLVIEHSQLMHVADDLDRRPEKAGRRTLAEGVSTQTLLRTALSETASPWLRDIIATIQAQQYALIAAPANQVLIVQGVAGSGKTSIALHRLSYHVYPALAAGKAPPRCLVFGPNRLFLKYVSAVLPTLGLHHVVQTTMADWALARVGLDHLRLTDTTFDTLLAPDQPSGPWSKDALYRRSRLKTSRRMGTLLERYVGWRRGQVEIPADGWLVEQTLQHTLSSRRLAHRVPAEALRERHARLAGRPFAVHRAAFVESVLTFVTTLMGATGQVEAEAQLALGRRRLKQAAEQQEEVRRLQASREPAAAAFGAAPTFGSLSRAGGRAMPVLPRSGGPAAGAADPVRRQTIRQLELSAQRRQQEGETLVREAEAALAAMLSPAEQERARRGARPEVQRLVDRHWPPIDALRDYHALLADTTLLRHLAGGVFDDEEVALLAGPAAESVAGTGGTGGKDGTDRAPATVDASDLPAIHYLFVLSQGPEEVGRTGHDYVVIDEAQDVAELDLHCLRTLERRQCFTLLGDLAQSIYGHRGLTSWSQAETIFAGAPYTYEECAVSYRTTAEITQLANRMLRSIRGTTNASSGAGRPLSPSGAPDHLSDPMSGTAEAEPFDRHGPPPTLTAAAGEAELVTAVVHAVAAGRARAYGSVAIITKTADRARGLAASLEAAGIADVALATAPDFEYRGGVVLLPVALAKGLEFDAAVVVDADAHTYPATAFDARLLYVALTRALHDLHVIWTGALTPHLEA